MSQRYFLFPPIRILFSDLKVGVNAVITDICVFDGNSHLVTQAQLTGFTAEIVSQTPIGDQTLSFVRTDNSVSVRLGGVQVDNCFTAVSYDFPVILFSTPSANISPPSANVSRALNFNTTLQYGERDSNNLSWIKAVYFEMGCFYVNLEDRYLYKVMEVIASYQEAIQDSVIITCVTEKCDTVSPESVIVQTDSHFPARVADLLSELYVPLSIGMFHVPTVCMVYAECRNSYL